tara:strand:- start:2651 stop:2815 length:165 start_codon:yes stop_codon:yes gene_type:complete
MEELIVEGLDYEDFVSLKGVLEHNTTFTTLEKEEYANTLILIEKVNKIIEVFEE